MIYTKERWTIYILIIIFFIYRIIKTDGFYVVAYIVSLFHLQQTIYFFTPKGVPIIDSDTIVDSFPET